MRIPLALLVTGLALCALPSLAQEQAAPAQACATMDAALPAEWSAWTKPGTLTAATDQPSLAKAELTVDRTSKARLSSPVAWPAPPEKSPAAGSKGGLLLLNVTQAGRYAVGLGAAAWLDVVLGSVEQKTVGHGHGPDCSSIRKYVEYDLKPGRYVLQVSGTSEPEVSILVIKRP